MKTIKRITTILIVLFISVGLFGCEQNETTTNNDANKNTLEGLLSGSYGFLCADDVCTFENEQETSGIKIVYNVEEAIGSFETYIITNNGSEDIRVMIEVINIDFKTGEFFWLKFEDDDPSNEISTSFGNVFEEEWYVENEICQLDDFEDLFETYPMSIFFTILEAAEFEIENII